MDPLTHISFPFLSDDGFNTYSRVKYKSKDKGESTQQNYVYVKDKWQDNAMFVKDGMMMRGGIREDVMAGSANGRV
jgi:hypothetical protein